MRILRARPTLWRGSKDRYEWATPDRCWGRGLCRWPAIPRSCCLRAAFWRFGTAPLSTLLIFLSKAIRCRGSIDRFSWGCGRCCSAASIASVVPPHGFRAYSYAARSKFCWSRKPTINEGIWVVTCLAASWQFAGCVWSVFSWGGRASRSTMEECLKGLCIRFWGSWPICCLLLIIAIMGYNGVKLEGIWQLDCWYFTIGFNSAKKVQLGSISFEKWIEPTGNECCEMLVIWRCDEIVVGPNRILSLFIIESMRIWIYRRTFNINTLLSYSQPALNSDGFWNWPVRYFNRPWLITDPFCSNSHTPSKQPSNSSLLC